MKKLFLLFAMLCTLFSAGATDYYLHVWGTLKTTLEAAGLSGINGKANDGSLDIPFTNSGNSGLYYISISNTFTLDASQEFGLTDGNQTWVGSGPKHEANNWYLFSGDSNAKLNPGTYKSITLYVNGNNKYLYFSTSSTNAMTATPIEYYLHSWDNYSAAFSNYEKANFLPTSAANINVVNLGSGVESVYNANEGAGSYQFCVYNTAQNNFREGTTITYCKNNWVNISTDGTNNIQTQNSTTASTYYKVYFNSSSFAVYASTIPSTITLATPTVAQVPGSTTAVQVTVAAPTDITSVSSDYITSYDVYRDGTLLTAGTAVTPQTSDKSLSFTDNTAKAGTEYSYTVVLHYIDCSGGPALATAQSAAASITPVTYPGSLSSDATPNAVIGNCFKLTASAGGGEGTRYSKWLDKHYRITFPATQITWDNNTPTGYTRTYTSLVIKNGNTVMRTLDAEDINAEISKNGGTSPTLIIYGVYGATTATLTCTYTKDGSTTFTTTNDIAITYSDPASSNYINNTTATGKVYNVDGGSLVAEVHATDGGDVKSTAASYYDLKRYKGATISYTFKDYGATTLYKFTTSETMRPFEINFVDQIRTNRGTLGNITSDDAGNYYYLIVPHYSMVNLPILSRELTQFLNPEDNNNHDRTLTLTPSTAPTLELEKVGNAKVKTSTPAVTNGEALLGTYTTDVVSYEKGVKITENTNEKVVSFGVNDIVPTGIEGVTVANVSIIGGEGMITVNGANNVAIYDTTGRLITKVAGQNQIDMPAGLYIVRADSKVAKVVVK